MKTRGFLLLTLTLNLVLVLGGCPDEGATGAKAVEAAKPVEATGTAPVLAPAKGPSEEARARAEALREQKPRTTTEIRAGWAMAACAAGCDEKQEAIATRLSAASQLVPLTRDGVPVGLQLVQLRAYSPWISCRLEPGDRITAVEQEAVRTEQDIPRVIRACTVGQALTVERRGERQEIAARAPAKPTPAGAAPRAKEVLPAGTRDLE